MVVAFFCIAGLSLCVGMTRSTGDYDVSVTQMIDAERGLDLRAVGEMLKQADDAATFEKLLNANNGANNLDLNADGKVDYIKVTEFGDGGVRGFSLTTEVAPGDVQEVATIKIEKADDGGARVEYQGNETIFGQGHYYHSHWSPGFGSGLLLGYLFAPHRPYYSPWGWGSYPPSYATYATMPQETYSRRWNGASGYASGATSRVGSSMRSPNAGRNATGVKARLRNPTSAQRSFQQREMSKTRRSGGFGRFSSVRRTSYGRSARGFGK